MDYNPIFASLLRKTTLKTFKKNDDSVAQLVEHNTFNVGVLGSNPSGITKRKCIFEQQLLLYQQIQMVKRFGSSAG